MIDFHCHLDLYPDPQGIARACADHGVRVLSVTTTPSAWLQTSALADSLSWTALGLHPQLAHERNIELGLFDDLITRTRYVGEVGLDGGPEFRAHRRDQSAVFEHILQACARAGGRTMSVHSRRAADAVLDGLEAHPGAGTCVLHWFSGSQRELKRAIELKCWFSVGPAMLNGKRGRTLAALMPRDRILTESDGPFARIDHRSILPWEVGRAVKILSDLWGSDVEETQLTLNDNLQRLTEGR